MRIRIPARVNRVLDQALPNAGLILAAVGLGAATALGLFFPVAGALLLGVVIGGIAVGLVLGRRLRRANTRLAAESHQVGVLNQRIAAQAHGAIAQDSLTTHKLPTMPNTWSGGDDAA